MGNAISVGSTSPYTHTAPGLHIGVIALHMYILLASFLSQSANTPAESSSAFWLFSSPLWSSSSSSLSPPAYAAGTIVNTVVTVTSNAAAIKNILILKIVLLFMQRKLCYNIFTL